MSSHTTSRPTRREETLRRLERRWLDDLRTLDAMGLHLAAANLDGALDKVRQTMVDDPG